MGLHEPGIKEALRLWQQVNLRLISDEKQDLTARQMALLLTVYLEAETFAIKDIAARLGISKPAVCRAVDTLSQIGFLRRIRDEQDRRNVYIERTSEGADFLKNLGETMMQSLGQI